MTKDPFHYQGMIDRALKGVVREAIGIMAREGPSGGHNFYVTFATEHPGVVLPDSLKADYPGEMTVVLEHQFWDLDAGPEMFEVSLSFSGMRHHLAIPYAAITSFVDPSVEFALKFDSGEPTFQPAAQPVADTATETAAAPAAGLHSLPDEARAPNADEAPEPQIEEPEDENLSTKVVPLDAFRKK